MIQFDNAVVKYNKLILNEMKDQNIICWLAGGTLRDYFMGIPTKTDYDIFFPNQKEFDKAYVYFKSKGCEFKWESENGCKIKYDNNTYDLVKKYFNGPQETIDQFDFTVSMFAVDNNKVYHGETSFIDLSKRQLMFNKITYPASTMSRAFRYYKKGFSMCMGEMKKLFEAIQNEPKKEPDQIVESISPQIININDLNLKQEISSGDLADFFAGVD
jgi:hypothetical protein